MPQTFLVIGCGAMGRRRVRHVLTLRRAEVLVHDLRSDRMREAVAGLGVEAMEDFSALEGRDVRAAFICVPPADHETYMNWALDRGLPFMVEQPISHRLEVLAALRGRVESSGLVVHVSNNHRHSARVRAVERILRSGELGRPLTGFVEIGEWLPDWHPYEPYTDYYPSRRARGGGLDAVCDLDWLRYLFGEVEVGRCLASKSSDLDIDTPDVAQFLFSFDSGAQIALHTDMLQRPFSAGFKFVLSGGVIVHRAPGVFLEVYRATRSAWERTPFDDGARGFESMIGKPGLEYVEAMYQEDTRHFLDRLDSADSSNRSLIDGIRNVQIVYELLAW